MNLTFARSAQTALGCAARHHLLVGMAITLALPGVAEAQGLADIFGRVITAAAKAANANQNSGTDNPAGLGGRAALICQNAEVTRTELRLIRNWAERYGWAMVERAAGDQARVEARAVSVQGGRVVCRATITNTTMTLPMQRTELRDIEFEYSEVGGQGNIKLVTFNDASDDYTRNGEVLDKLFYDGQPLRKKVEVMAETDPGLRSLLTPPPSSAGQQSWNPEAICTSALNPDSVSQAVTAWATQIDVVRDTGITLAETPSWLPTTGWAVSNVKQVSSVPSYSVTCTASVAFRINRFRGGGGNMRLDGMNYRVTAGSPGAFTKVEAFNWPNAAQFQRDDNAFNRALSVNGMPYAQLVAAQDRARPQPHAGQVDPLTAMVNSANAELRAEAKRKGINVEAMRRQAEEETRKYAEACRAHGGTWGYPVRGGVATGDLGCYYQTVGR